MLVRAIGSKCFMPYYQSKKFAISSNKRNYGANELWINIMTPLAEPVMVASSVVGSMMLAQILYQKILRRQAKRNEFFVKIRKYDTVIARSIFRRPSQTYKVINLNRSKINFNTGCISHDGILFDLSGTFQIHPVSPNIDKSKFLKYIDFDNVLTKNYCAEEVLRVFYQFVLNLEINDITRKLTFIDVMIYRKNFEADIRESFQSIIDKYGIIVHSLQIDRIELFPK